MAEKPVLNETLWLPREEAESIVRERKFHAITGGVPVAVGLHPNDHTRACLLMWKPSRDPIPIWSGVPVYRLDAEDFS